MANQVQACFFYL